MLVQYPSLFSYCVKEIGLTEAIKSGEVSVSKLRHVCSVINKDNQEHWIQKANTETKQKLTDEVAISDTLEKRDPVKRADRGQCFRRYDS